MVKYGPLSCKPMIKDFIHRTEVPPDDGGPITFQWHFQRGILKPRMSGLELCEFVITHMPAIIPLLSDHPRVQSEFYSMLLLMVSTPKSKLDELLPWIRTVVKQADDDVIHMSLYDNFIQAAGPVYFVGM
jgi:hypothetical protein